MWELCVKLAYGHKYIILTLKKGKFQSQNNKINISKTGSINSLSLKFSYHRLANTKKLILLQEKYFKYLKDILSGAVSKYFSIFFFSIDELNNSVDMIFQLFTIFQSWKNNDMREIWVVGICETRKNKLKFLLG